MPEPCTLTHEAAVKLCGLPLPEQPFNSFPLGYQVMIVREMQKEEAAEGGVVITPSDKRVPMSRGWIVAAGADIGTPRDKPCWPGPPETALGKKVIFGAYMGIGICITPPAPGSPDDWSKPWGGWHQVQQDMDTPIRVMDVASIYLVEHDEPDKEEPTDGVGT